MLNKSDAVELVTDTLMPMFLQEQARLEIIDLWYRWKHEDPIVPSRATAELRSLIEMARTPWLGVVVTSTAQTLRIEGYRSPHQRDDLAPWASFMANGLLGRQRAIYRASLAYGASYLTVMPGADPVTGNPMAVLRGQSPRRMLPFYADPAEDDWPLYALRQDGPSHWRLYDDTVVYRFGIEENDRGEKRLVYIDYEEHNVGVCPVVRFSNMLDLEGRTDGEIEPLISTAKRINKTVYDRLLIQHFSSWKTRTIAGMAEPEGEEAANREKLRLRHEDLLIAEDPDAKFGTLPETPLDGIIRAFETDIKSLASVSQTPLNELTGDMVNLAAEAIALTQAQKYAKSDERKQSYTGSWNQALRLGAYIDGDETSASDMLASVRWSDTSIRSMAQAVDALGKLATMLGVPVQALWEMVPGVTSTDIEEWKALAAEGDAMAQLAAVLDRQGTQPTPTGV